MASLAIPLGEGAAAERVGKLTVKQVVYTSLIGAVAILAAIAVWNYVTSYQVTSAGTAATP